MNLEDLKNQYLNIPQEMQDMRHWVGYRLESVDGRMTKVPYNAITGEKAQSNNPKTWTTFNVALNGIIKYGFTGLGFMLGAGITGIDLDNHEGGASKEEFEEFAQKFITKINSYTERSVSGLGIHIICKGTLPEGRRRNGPVEMYCANRFFACTGNVINFQPVNDSQEDLIELWKEFVDDSATRQNINKPVDDYDFSGSYAFGTIGRTYLTDDEVIRKAMNSENGVAFSRVWNGNLIDYWDNINGKEDQSRADLGLCSYLAFWCNGDEGQVDRLFRSSPYFASKDEYHVKKWDSLRGSEVYGRTIVRKACSSITKGYQPSVHANKDVTHVTTNDTSNVTTYEPEFHIKDIYKNYPFTDTGNAERFYDYFGDLFKYNKAGKYFMYWDGKTWIDDTKDIIRKYANKLIDIMKDDAKRIEKEVKDAMADGNNEEAKHQEDIYDAAMKNINRLSNKAGKDAMLSEFQSLHDVPVLPEEFNKDPFLLNTESGIVNLKTGDIAGFDKEKMLSKNTHVKVSYETPTTWLSFLNGIFYRGNGEKEKRETSELINFFQQVLWYSLTGSTREQCLFILHGGGSNGKSTCINQVMYILGDYANSMDSSMLMSQSNSNSSVQFTLANLIGCRFLVTKESNDGDRLDEGLIKGLTGGDVINAQEKFGKPFEFTPQFKPFLMTNNLPFIRGTDHGIWRRIKLIPFLRKFADNEKDMDMPEKLKLESDKILGWCIQGGKKYAENGNKLVIPACLESALSLYREDNDVVAKFLSRCTKDNVSGKETCTDIFNAFKNWGANNKEFVMRESKFSEEMNKKGYRVEIDKTTSEKCYVGLNLLESARPTNSSAYKTFEIF